MHIFAYVCIYLRYLDRLFLVSFLVRVDNVAQALWGPSGWPLSRAKQKFLAWFLWQRALVTWQHDADRCSRQIPLVGKKERCAAFECDMLDNCLRRRLNTHLFCENIASGSTDLKRTDQNSSKFKAHSILQGALLLLRGLPEIKSLAHETGTVPVLVLLSPGLQFNSFIGDQGSVTGSLHWWGRVWRRNREKAIEKVVVVVFWGINSILKSFSDLETGCSHGNSKFRSAAAWIPLNVPRSLWRNALEPPCPWDLLARVRLWSILTGLGP